MTCEQVGKHRWDESCPHFPCPDWRYRMSREHLIQVMQTHQNAIEADQEPLLVRENIVSVLRALEQGDITRGQAIRLLTYQALLAEEPVSAVLYRQAAAAIRQMQREGDGL